MRIPLKKNCLVSSEFSCLGATLINFVRIKFVSMVVDVWLKEISLQEVIESPTKSSSLN